MLLLFLLPHQHKHLSTLMNLKLPEAFFGDLKKVFMDYASKQFQAGSSSGPTIQHPIGTEGNRKRRTSEGNAPAAKRACIEECVDDSSDEKSMDSDYDAISDSDSDTSSVMDIDNDLEMIPVDSSDSESSDDGDQSIDEFDSDKGYITEESMTDPETPADTSDEDDESDSGYDS